MITEDYVSNEVAKLLREKGFDEPCYAYWVEDENRLIISQSMHSIRNITNPCFFGPAAPTPQMARKWLRKTHNIFISVNLTITEDPDEYPPFYYVYILDTKTGESLIKYDETNLLVDEDKLPRCFEEPEQAVDVALKYTLENLLTLKIKEES